PVIINTSAAQTSIQALSPADCALLVADSIFASLFSNDAFDVWASAATPPQIVQRSTAAPNEIFRRDFKVNSPSGFFALKRMPTVGANPFKLNSRLKRAS